MWAAISDFAEVVLFFYALSSSFVLSYPAIVYLVDLNPAKGREQAGPRYVIIVSPREFNRLGTPRVCPTTQGGNFGLL